MFFLMHRWIKYQKKKGCTKVRAWNGTCQKKIDRCTSYQFFFTSYDKSKVEKMAAACCEDQAAMITDFFLIFRISFAETVARKAMFHFDAISPNWMITATRLMGKKKLHRLKKKIFLIRLHISIFFLKNLVYYNFS